MEIHVKTLVIVVAASLVLGTAAAQTLNVPGTYPTIQSAIGAALPGATILVAPGTYSGGINFLGKAVTVQSSGGASVTTILGAPGQRVVQFVSGEAATTVLNGFRIAGGGGGVTCQNSSPTIMNCTITGNFASSASGGGLECRASTNASPTVSHCTISGNIADQSGGGIYVETTGSGTCYALFDECAILGNTANGGTNNNLPGGGGMMVRNLGASAGCSPTLVRCTFQNNAGVGPGGGLAFLAATSPTVTGCRFIQNTAGFYLNWTLGGGLYSEAAGLLLSGSVFAGNSALMLGGGAFVVSANGGSAALTNNVFYGNSSGGGAGLFTSPGAGVAVTNCILWGNLGPDLGFAGAAAPNVTYSDIGSGAFAANPTNRATDPSWIDPAGGDFHLAPSSPCRNAGTSGAFGLPATDLDGGPRVVGVVDMGVDEVPNATLPGTGERLHLYTQVSGAGDPNSPSHPATTGQQLSIRMHSPLGTFVSAQPVVLAEVFTTGAPPPNLGIPGVQMNLNVSITIAGSLTPLPFPAPGLTPAGIALYAPVPPGVSGNTLRIQGFCAAPWAANGIYAATDAHEITL